MGYIIVLASPVFLGLILIECCALSFTPWCSNKSPCCGTTHGGVLGMAWCFFGRAAAGFARPPTTACTMQ